MVRSVEYVSELALALNLHDWSDLWLYIDACAL